MTGLIASTTAQFLATFGFSLDSLVTYIVSQAMTILGLGLALLQALLPTIIGITAIWVVIKIVPKVLKFLHIWG